MRFTVREIARYYDSTPESISSPFGGVGTWDVEHPYLDEVLETMGIDLEGKKILDVGCGSGWFSVYCMKRGCFYCGIDITDRCIQLTNKVASRVLKASGDSLPFASGFFDYVFFMDSFEHLTRQKLAVEEASRVLAESGRVFVSVPNYSNMCGIVKKIEEAIGFYRKDTWAPFNFWAPQALEHFMTPGRVKQVFSEGGFENFRMIGGHSDFLDGIFPWINHRFMLGASIIRKAFSLIERPLTKMFPWLSLHNFWLIGK